jgi:hypothetical protein
MFYRANNIPHNIFMDLNNVMLGTTQLILEL